MMSGGIDGSVGIGGDGVGVGVRLDFIVVVVVSLVVGVRVVDGQLHPSCVSF